MKKLYIALGLLLFFFLTGCSSETVKRTTYETLQNVKERNCRQDPSTDCEKRETFEDYRRKRDALNLGE